MRSLDVGTALANLRRQLIWEGMKLDDYFHATEDKQNIRDRVYEKITEFDLKIQATICEKSKAQPQVRKEKARFYKYPWYYQFKHGVSKIISNGENVFVTAASIGIKKERVTFCNALDDVMYQTFPRAKWAVDFRPSQCDPCLQTADYCAWAIQRKWERGDRRSYDIIRHMISYEYDLWQHGETHYY